MTGLRTFLRGSLAALALVGGSIAAGPSALAASPYLEVVDPAEAMASPAYRYANMSNEEAFAELDRRRILYLREKPTHGVRAPIRLTGRLHGVHVHSALPPEQRPTTPFEVLDARLALALDDFCAILARHDVDELVHYTMYRPNVPPPGWAPPPATAQKKDAAPAEPRGASRSAKRRAEPGEPRATLGKGERAGGKGGAPGRARTSRKELGDAESEPLAPKDLDELEQSLEIGSDETDAPLAKAAPRKPAAKPATARAGHKTTGTRATATREPRRGASPLRRPPSREDDEQHTHKKPAPPGTRHPAGLAIDLGAVKKRDGRWLSVASHFRGKLGERTCGPTAPTPDSAEARELRAIVCEARAAGVFTYALTPNFDADHADHVHFEIKPGVTWFLYH